jgi:hypothetical protein
LSHLVAFVPVRETVFLGRVCSTAAFCFLTPERDHSRAEKKVQSESIVRETVPRFGLTAKEKFSI